MDSTTAAEGQERPFDIVIWTRDYKEKPRQFEKWIEQWMTEIQDSDRGAVLIRDTPFHLGPEGLPRELLVSTCLWSCNVVFLIVGGDPLLPLVDLEEEDADRAYKIAGGLIGRPEVKQLIVFTPPQDAERWRALVEYHNPGAWICRIDCEGSRIVKDGAGDASPVPGRPA
ncbi:hypothetical protein [Mesorhizobium sp.]|uniref:hypothetical protein n=1 Tax=Mesorhizobium sp. TaxID=1871066 RepID=UPI000FEA3BF2|nr:hypothetical protein [Mesorhizobium sp.]RWD79735.1 MAG: hypothetical protein EOS48_21180 [Mesorhizobium sp.]